MKLFTLRKALASFLMLIMLSGIAFSPFHAVIAEEVMTSGSGGGESDSSEVENTTENAESIPTNTIQESETSSNESSNEKEDIGSQNVVAEDEESVESDIVTATTSNVGDSEEELKEIGTSSESKDLESEIEAGAELTIDTSETETASTSGTSTSSQASSSITQTTASPPITEEQESQSTSSSTSTLSDIVSLPVSSITSSSTSLELSGTSTEATTTSYAGTSTVPSHEFGSTTPLGNTEIVSGSSIALANILNLVNTNFVNSDGVVVFKNFFETLLEDFDLRDFYNSLLSFGCSLTTCSSDTVHTNISNDAVINNELYINATTGGNLIEGSGNASISTGNAYAGVNLVNVANTNVIDSNYLLVTMNAFQDVNGDIIFPSLSGFFNTIGNSASPSSLDVTNTADVVNNVNLNAEAGNNTAVGNGSSTISTGNSTAVGNVFNQLNTSLVGGQSVSILFRVQGDWAGEIFGAPDNLGWMDDGEGGIYLFDKNVMGNLAMGNANIGVKAKNTASIHNNVNVVALTGENAITGSETALISTGNAYAGVNIMNIANATVVGRNWILAIVNILGDFNGNIAFGRPDLWIGGKVDVPSKIKNESILKYTFTVINNGDSTASNVVLKDAYDARFLDIQDASLPYTADAATGNLVWKLPNLAAGEAIEVRYSGRVKDTSYGTLISNEVMVMSRETDNNIVDNSDVVSVKTDSHSRSSNNVRISLSSVSRGKGVVGEIDANAVNPSVIRVERMTASSTINPFLGTTITERLIVRNLSNDTVSNVVLHDLLFSPQSNQIANEIFELGDVLPHEEIEILYDLSFKNGVESGVYTLATRITSVDIKNMNHQFNGKITILPRLNLSDEFQIPLSLSSVIEPLVLGAEATNEVSPQENEFMNQLLPSIAEAAENDVNQGLPKNASPYRFYFILVAIALFLAFLGFTIPKAKHF